MRNAQEYRDHADAAEEMATRTNDHLLKTNFLQLARNWRAAAEEAQRSAAKALNAA
jgi:hypothetical protein